MTTDTKRTETEKPHATPTREQAEQAARSLGISEPLIAKIEPGEIGMYGGAKVVHRNGAVSWAYHTLVMPDEGDKKPYLVWGHYGYSTPWAAYADATN